MNNEQQWLFDLKQGIVGIWNNNDYSFTFNGIIGNNFDGAAIMHNKHSRSDTGANYNIFIQDGRPFVRIIIIAGIAMVAREFYFSLIDSDKLTLTNPQGFLAELDRVV